MSVGRRMEVGQMLRRMGVTAGLVTVISMVSAPAGAVHFYRGPGGGCTPAQGELGEQTPEGADVAAEVLMLHNTFFDPETGAPVTVVEAGESVRWTWNSEHCHSVQNPGFYSGYHYPELTPSTPVVAPGLFDHPVPELKSTSLAYTKTFTEPGTYTYSCEHHAAIGMVGVVVVE